MDAADTVVCRFPLIPRPRPPCSPLPTRVAGIADLARSAIRDSNLAAASAAFNQAALLASDCGLPGLARQWCHRHARAYLRACPLTAQAARHALEPMVNLARLHIRDGNGEAAFRLLDTLYSAVTCRRAVTIDGMPVAAGTLTRSPRDHHDLRRWLWTVHLSDSPRALISAGRWQDALTHLQRHNGIGRRMLDGRQVAVIAHHLAGDTDTALTLLDDTTATQDWEHAVTACLRVLCHQHALLPASQQITAMLDAYRQFTPKPGLAVFHTRLGLSVIDIAGEVERSAAREIAKILIADAASDGYAAREVLAHPGCTAMITSDQAHTLTRLLDRCALGHRHLPAQLEADLSAAVGAAEKVICYPPPPKETTPPGLPPGAQNERARAYVLPHRRDASMDVGVDAGERVSDDDLGTGPGDQILHSLGEFAGEVLWGEQDPSYRVQALQLRCHVRSGFRAELAHGFPDLA